MGDELKTADKLDVVPILGLMMLAARIAQTPGSPWRVFIQAPPHLGWPPMQLLREIAYVV